jgi:hypothetical protein
MNATTSQRYIPDLRQDTGQTEGERPHQPEQNETMFGRGSRDTKTVGHIGVTFSWVLKNAENG